MAQQNRTTLKTYFNTGDIPTEAQFANAIDSDFNIVDDTLDNIADGVVNRVFTATEKTKLLGIADGATANDTDANLKARANHTGTQEISTVTNLQTTLDAKEITANKGIANGYAELDGTGKVPTSQLPSYVDDVLEYVNLAGFPVTGETEKIYVALDTNLTYRWSGTVYVEISASLALGETSSTAYRGDRGKTAYDHSQLVSGNPHSVTKAEVGLGNVPNIDATSRANHTGTQTASTISDFDTSADARIAAAVGVSVQAYDAQLVDMAGLTPTKGSMIVGDGTNFVSIGVGADTQIMTADSTQPTGVKWAAGGGGGATSIDELSDAIADTTSVYLGTGSGASETTATNNTALGIDSGKLVTTGSDNTAIGFESMKAQVTTGSGNTSVGSQALGYGTTIDGARARVTAIGYRAGYRGVSDGFTAIGYKAGENNAGGSAIGTTAIGYMALNNCYSASNNTVIGYSAVAGAYFTGSNNVVVGESAGYSMTSAQHCTLIGKYAGNSTTTANSATYIGSSACWRNTGGYGNTVVGAYAAANSTTGSYLCIVGYGSCGNLTTGTNNVAFGYNSGLGLTTGSYNTIIGNSITGLASSLSNTIIIGDGGGNKRIWIDSVGNTGLKSIIAPTASLHLPASTTAASTAPLKFNSGTLMTTPEDGAFEFDGTNLYFTIGGTRKTITLV